MKLAAVTLLLVGMFAVDEMKAKVGARMKNAQSNYENQHKSLNKGNVVQDSDQQTIERFLEKTQKTKRIVDYKTLREKFSKYDSNKLTELSGNLLKMIIKYLSPKNIYILVWTSKTMKSKVYSICRPKVHSKAPVHLLILGEMCFPDFTKKSENLQILHVADFFVFKRTNTESIFAMSGDKELFVVDLKTISTLCRRDNGRTSKMRQIVPNYFYKSKCVKTGADCIYVCLYAGVEKGYMIRHVENGLTEVWCDKLNSYFCSAYYKDNREYFSYGELRDRKIIKAKFEERLANQKSTFGE